MLVEQTVHMFVVWPSSWLPRSNKQDYVIWFDSHILYNSCKHITWLVSASYTYEFVTREHVISHVWMIYVTYIKSYVFAYYTCVCALWVMCVIEWVLYRYIYVHMYVHIYMYVYICVLIYTYIYMNIHVYVYTYIYIHLSTYVHIYWWWWLLLLSTVVHYPWLRVYVAQIHGDLSCRVWYAFEPTT